LAEDALMQRIAVLAYDVHSFEDALRGMFEPSSGLRLTRRGYAELPCVAYQFIGRPEQARGWTFDGLLLLNGYDVKPGWQEIIELLRYNMRRRG
jgi:hypothetical protein